MQAIPRGIALFCWRSAPGREKRAENLKLGIPNSGCRQEIGPLADCHRPALKSRGQKITEVESRQLRVSFTEEMTPKYRCM